MDDSRGKSTTKSPLSKSLRKGGMLSMVAALAMSGLARGANFIKSAGNILRGKGRKNASAYESARQGAGHSRGHRRTSGNYKGKSKHRIRFHPVNAGLPFNEKIGYLNSKLNGRALERYFEAVENLHGPDKANRERIQAGYAA